MVENDPTSETFPVHKDAFSSGQVGSKLWLCEELERILLARVKKTSGDVVWIYGGWNGVLGFLLLSRGKVPMTVRSFDADPACEQIANTLCENWVWREWQFRAFTKDCNELSPSTGDAVTAGDAGASGDFKAEFGPPPSIVINTSVEHFDRDDWFQKIPSGTLVALQAADFDHDGAVSVFKSERALSERYPLKEKLFSGEMKFDYSSWSFRRFMTIGVR